MMTATDGALQLAAGHARFMLDALGITGDEGTPLRLVRALDELAAGRDVDPDRHLLTQFDAVSPDPGLVVVADIPITSLCEHHMLPFTGAATVAYLPLPGESIVGLSKVARMVTEYAARAQLQERLTCQVADALATRLPVRGSACAVRGTHTCMALRGSRTGLAAAMVTVEHRGDLARAPWREQFGANLWPPGYRP